ncbi:hypothetical protein KIW84_070414 [Lathyrus oleraceus]|uniref:Uncharacterized protein n=1 Tax=Pisum sativum TaxID=3888 RepID=A0A9D4VHS2_PEA|nr:hypothetical protein KIW84_070414 [Pisum sativum]
MVNDAEVLSPSHRLRLTVSPSTMLKFSHRLPTALKSSLRIASHRLTIHNKQNSLNLSPKEENNFSLKVECFTSKTMTSSKNDYEIEVQMRHSYIPVNISSINEKLTTTQRAHIECNPFKWAMDISNNFSISGNKVFTGFIKKLDDLDALDTYSWGIAVYNFVVSSLCESSVVLKEGKNTTQRHLNGCAAILQFVDVTDYHKLVVENKDFKERISVLEYEVRIMKEARVNSPFEDEVVQDDRQLVNFITKDEVGTFAGDVGYNTPFNDDANVAEN